MPQPIHLHIQGTPENRWMKADIAHLAQMRGVPIQDIVRDAISAYLAAADDIHAIADHSGASASDIVRAGVSHLRNGYIMTLDSAKAKEAIDTYLKHTDEPKTE